MELKEQLMPLKEIQHPFNSMVFAHTDDVDEMWTMLDHVKFHLKCLRDVEYQLRNCIGFLTEGEAKTRRVVGKEHTVKLTFPSDVWTQSTLKELALDDADMSKLYLRIATYAPQMKEVKKLESTSGTERFEAYKEKLLSARQPSGSPPVVTLETSTTVKE